MRWTGVVLTVIVLVGCTPAYEVPELPPPPTDVGRAPLWTARLPAGLDEPVHAQVAGQVVVVQGNQGVAAFDRRDGRLLWEEETRLEFVTVADKGVVMSEASSSQGEVRVLDLATGTERLREGGVRLAGVTRDSLLLVEDAEAELESNVLAFDLATGRRRWDRSVGLFQGGLLPARLPEPRLRQFPPRTVARGLDDPLRPPDDGRLLVQTFDRVPENGVLPKDGREPTQVLDVRTGKTIAEYRVGELCGGVQNGDIAIALPLFRSDCEDGKVSAINTRSGKALWKFGGLPKRTHNVPEPVVTDEGVLVLTDQQVPTFLELSTGRQQWKGNAGEDPLGVSGRTAVLRDRNGEGDLVVVDMRTGNRLWSRKLPYLIVKNDPYWMESHAVSAGRFFYSGREHLPKSISRPGNSIGGVLHAVDLRNGKDLWVSRRDLSLLGVGSDWLVAGAVSLGKSSRPDQLHFYELKV